MVAAVSRKLYGVKLAVYQTMNTATSFPNVLGQFFTHGVDGLFIRFFADPKFGWWFDMRHVDVITFGR